MKEYSNISTINSRVYLEIPSTALEETLKEVLAKENKHLNSGIIENSIKHDFYLKEYIFLRRVTRPNKLGHNLIYLREVGFDEVYINNLIKRGLDKYENEKEYICIGSCGSKEYYASVLFEMEPKVYKATFNDFSLMKGFKTDGWQEDAINIARKLDKDIIKNRLGSIIAHIPNKESLKKVVEELIHNYFKGNYKVYKNILRA